MRGGDGSVREGLAEGVVLRSGSPLSGQSRQLLKSSRSRGDPLRPVPRLPPAPGAALLGTARS
jgi:hypothetical protein